MKELDVVDSKNQTPDPYICNIAIVGGGFSGAMLAVQLLRAARGNPSIALIERGHFPGRGVAYGTTFDGHLLNVRAENMSAYPDVPDDFVKWAQRNYNSSVKHEDFLPRPLYGQYVISQLEETTKSYPGVLRYIQDEAVSVTRFGKVLEVALQSGQAVVADKVVLAVGHFPPADHPIPGKTRNSSRFISNPWSPDASTHADRDQSLLLIGSGLTSVDVVLGLRARGFNGTIHILSRRGLLPQSHRSTATVSVSWALLPRTARGLLHRIRAQVKDSSANGVDWRGVIDSLRPATQEIWRDLPPVEQRRFLRHLRPYWDVHRHRIAESIADQLALEMRSGKIQVHAGRITEYREDSAGAEISYRERRTEKTVMLRADRIINCTGPDSDLRRVESPLLADLLHKEQVRLDELSLGLDVDANGAILDAQRIPSESLFAVGPLRKGKLWESIAVPELRVQAAQLAKLLATAIQKEDSAALRIGPETELSSYPPRQP